MMARLALTLIIPASILLAPGCPSSTKGAPDAGPAPVTITGVSPRSTSNQTAQPLLIYGRGMQSGMKLRVGAPFGIDLALAVDDEGHAAAVLPGGLSLPADAPEATASVTLVDASGAVVGDPVQLVVVNDIGFLDVMGLVALPDLSVAFTASTSTDELFALDTASGKVDKIAVGDGPWAMAPVDAAASSIVVAHRYAPELAIVDTKTRAVRKIPGPAHAHAVVVDGGIAYVGEHANDELWAIAMADGKVLWRAPIGPNPRGIAVAGDKIAVGSLLDGEVRLVAKKDGAVSAGIAPRPGVAILRGHTAGYSKQVIGGKGVRALATLGGAIFVANTGPNTGPNADHMGVWGTGGVGVIDVKSQSYTRHLGFNYGVSQALALDQKRGRLYVADVGSGLLRVVDAKALAGKDEQKAKDAHLAEVPLLPLPTGFPLVRPAADFGTAPSDKDAPAAVGENVEHRAGVEVHTGPSALALSADGNALLVLERFTGRVVRVDVSKDVPVIEKSFTLFDALVQRERRMGAVLYFADLGRTGMSCDACHLDGHGEGVFYTKTGMERIWRSPTVRGVRDTPPYFNPPSHPDLADTCSYVGSNNRFQNPPMSPSETAQLVAFTQAYVTLPNPNRNGDGGLKDELLLDGGRTGRPKKGRMIFESRCMGCHPAPLFAPDQDERTRRRFMKVNTPPTLEIRVEQQNLEFQLRTPPSLVGAWDVWPMLLSAKAGFKAVDQDHLEHADRSPVRAVLERYSDRTHGDAGSLSPEARADLEAFVLSL